MLTATPPICTHLQWENGAPYCMQEVLLLMTPFCLGVHRVSTAFGNPCLALSLTWALFVQSWEGGGGLRCSGTASHPRCLPLNCSERRL